MAIDFKSIPTASELQQILAMHLEIGKASVADVQKFMLENSLNCSDEIERNEKTFRGINWFVEQTKEPFDTFIQCRFPPHRRRGKRTGLNPAIWVINWIDYLIFYSEYFVQFHFQEGILVEIITHEEITGF